MSSDEECRKHITLVLLILKVKDETTSRFVYERTNHVNLENQPLTKVMVTKYNDIRTARKYFDKTYEADVSFTHRYCIDEMTEIPEYDLRKWYWDMEWMNR